jgi:hypothetical protein
VKPWVFFVQRRSKLWQETDPDPGKKESPEEVKEYTEEEALLLLKVV